MRRRTVLVVDDVEANVRLLNAYLRAIDCQTVTARDGLTALEIVRSGGIDLVLLDVGLPGLDGFEVCRRIKSSAQHALLPVVMVTALTSVDDRVIALDCGASDFLTKPVQRIELVARVKSLLQMKALIDRLDDVEQVVFALARAVEARDHGLDEHTIRVATNSLAVARLFGLDADMQEQIFQGAMLHDVGKIGIPDSILLKPGPLLAEEMDVMRRHTLIGEDIVTPLRAAVGLRSIIRSHHERVDGRGYPDGRAADDIPLAARIVSVCDSYDAMISDRPYRRGLSRPLAVRTLRRGSGSQWDRRVVDVFLDAIGAGRHIRAALAVG